MRTASCWSPASIVRSSTDSTSSPGPIIATIAFIDARASATSIFQTGGPPSASIWSIMAFV